MPTPQALRQLNETRALAALFGAGGMSRADLARSLELTRSTTGNLVQSLTEAGLIRERAESGPETETRVGRPGILVEIEGDGAFFIGADIGVDRMTALAVDLAGEVRAKASHRFEGVGCDPRRAVDAVAELIDEVLAQLPAGATPRGFSVAIPGFPAADGVAYHAVILGWHGVALEELLVERLGGEVPLLLENDANAFAVAQTYRSSGQRGQAEDILFVLLESGVGGGIISRGRLHRGQSRGAGEIGHMRIGEEGFVFDPLRPGRLETYVGKDALLARYRYHGGAAATFDLYLEALAAGEPAARRGAEDWGRWLARGLSNLLCTLQPSRVILGGSVSAVYPFVADAVDALVAGALVEGFPAPLIQTSTAEAGGPALGAAYLLHQTMLSTGPYFRV